MYLRPWRDFVGIILVVCAPLALEKHGSEIRPRGGVILSPRCDNFIGAYGTGCVLMIVQRGMRRTTRAKH